MVDLSASLEALNRTELRARLAMDSRAEGEMLRSLQRERGLRAVSESEAGIVRHNGRSSFASLAETI